MAWWLIVLIASWPAAGLLTWVLSVLKARELVVSDLILLPIVVLMGWIAFGIWASDFAELPTKTLWRW